MQLLLRTHRDCINCLITNKYLKKNNYIYTKKEEKKKKDKIEQDQNFVIFANTFVRM